MPTETYTIKIKDLLSVEDARERWILVKKALAANVRQESTKAVEFGYVDLDHASDRLRHMMDEQSETMTLPQGLEPVDPSDELSDTRVLLLPWARHFAVQPGLRLASRKNRNKPRHFAREIVEVEPETVDEIVEAVEIPEVAETMPIEVLPPVADAPAVEDAVEVREHRVEDLPEVHDEIDEDDTPVSYPFTKARVPAAPAQAARAKTEEELDAEAGQFVSAFMDRVMEEEEKVEPVETEIPAKSQDELDAEAGQFISDFIDQVNVEEKAAEAVTVDETAQASEGVLPPLSETDGMVSGEAPDSFVDEVAEEVAPAAVIEETPMQTTEVRAEETAAVYGKTYAVDIEALLAIEDQRVRRILTRKVAAFMADRRYTSSIGKFVREAGSIEALLRRDGPFVRIPSGYEPVDSTDNGDGPVSLVAYANGDGPVSLVAYANGGEAAAKLEKAIIPPAAKPRGRQAKKIVPASEPVVTKARVNKSDYGKALDKVEVLAKQDAKPAEPIVATKRTRLDPASFAIVLTTAIADAIAPYLDAAGTGFRDGKEGLAASEYLARALEAEAALLRLSAFGRGSKD